MDVLGSIKDEWEKGMGKLERNPFFRAMRDGSFTRNHYAMFLREEYFNTMENPESLAMATFHLQGPKRALNKTLLRHAMAESGHNLMALSDLETLGFSVGSIPEEKPLATTEPFIAFFVYQIQHRNPLAYLAYIHHLESIAVAKGPQVISTLMALGIPKEAMSFLTEHAEVDTVHTRWVSEYFTGLVKDRKDLEDILHGIRGAIALHGMMLEGIMDAVDGRDAAWLRLESFGKAQTPVH